MQSGRLDLAEKEFEELLRRAPAFTRCYEPLALIYFKSGQKEKCLDLFLKAKERGYDMTAYFKGLGLTFQESAR
jgi:Tfp pilus assembly protein PilF